MKTQMNRWHKQAAQVAGQMSMAIIKGKVTLGQLDNWAKTLQAVSVEMKLHARQNGLQLQDSNRPPA